MIGAFPGNPDNYGVYLRAASEGSLRARVVGALWWDRERGLEQIPELEERRGNGQVGRFNATSVKIMQDGIAENFTAGMLEPYLDGCGCATGNSGLSFIDPQVLTDAVSRLDRSGFQIHFHALGDRAVREVLDALAEARAANGANDNRHHLAHLQVVHPDDIGRFADLDAAANIQALWAAHEPQMDELTIPFLGPERARLQYPFGDLQRAGARLVAGSDWSVSSPNPLWGIHVAVNRSVPDEAPNSPGTFEPMAPFFPEQALTLSQALTAYTAGSAWVNHLDGVTGTVQEGKYADLVVLDRDPFAHPRWRSPTPACSARTSTANWSSPPPTEVPPAGPPPAGRHPPHRAHPSGSQTMSSARSGSPLLRGSRSRSRSRIRHTVAAALAAAAVLVTSACSGTAQPAKDQAAAYKLTDRTPAAVGGVDSFTWSLYAEPTTIDYAYSFDFPPNQILANVCESLLRWNPDLTTSPNLAASYTNPTPTTWVYQIRPGVKFHDGTALTADDVVASLRRNLDPGTASVWANQYKNVKSIDRTGPMEVTVTLTEPDSTFNKYLAASPGTVESAATLAKSGKDYGNPQTGVNCTGPFSFGSWTSGQSLTLKRFDGYWNQELKAKSGQVKFVFLADATTRVNAFQSGEVDGGWMVPPNAYAQLGSTGAGKLYFGRNTTVADEVVSNLKGPLGDPRVRQALLMAIDRKGIVKAGAGGVGEVSDSLTTDTLWADAPPATREALLKDLPKYPYDPTRAKALAAQAGVDGQKIVIATSPWTPRRRSSPRPSPRPPRPSA